MVDVGPGDRVQMRKKHPCGSDEWVIYRVGADIGLRCTGCDRRVMLPRRDFQRSLKRIIAHPGPEDGGDENEKEHSDSDV
jgi:hypothetical protein